MVGGLGEVGRPPFGFRFFYNGDFKFQPSSKTDIVESLADQCSVLLRMRGGEA